MIRRTNHKCIQPLCLRNLRRSRGLIILSLIMAGLSVFAVGCGCSDDRDMVDAPEFVEQESVPGDSVASSVEGPDEAARTKDQAASEEKDDLWGLPIVIELENVPSTPEKLTLPTPLSAIPGD